MTVGTAPPADEPLSALLAGAAPSSPAFIVPEDGQVLTYEQVADGIETLAGRLSAAGIRRGDRVALTLPNGPDFVQLLLAITLLGAAAAPLNPAYTHSEFTFFLTDIAPRLFLIPDGRPAAAASAAEATGTTVLTVGAAADGPPALLVAGEPVRAATTFERGGPDDVAVVLHTSGTTSRPKQVPLRQRNLMASARTIAAHYRLDPSDVSFSVMPLFHIHGLVASTFAALSAGGAVVAPRRFTPHRFWPQAREYGATWLSAGPTLHQMMLDKADEAGPPVALRFVRSCSSALSPALMRRAEDSYGVPMLEAYGMTEASHQMASNPQPPAARVPGSVGVPTGTEIGVVDKDGRFLPDGSPGEVVIRGPGVMSGYVNNPAATAEAFFGDWFRTGDRGALRDGYLYLEGRLKEMIIRGGENIAPAEIEEVLLSHPAVSDAVCFGVQDDKYGELVSAAVTLTQDAEARALIEHCRGQLAAFKVPTTIHVLAEIPRTPTGKVQRRRVAEFVGQGLAGHGQPAQGPAAAGPAAQPGTGQPGTGRPVKFAILGAGAIGAYVGAALARGGADVTLIARGPHLAAMRAGGVRVLSPRGDFAAHPRATDDLAAVADADVVFVALKAYSLPEIAPRLGTLLAPGAATIWAQNGIPWWYFQSLPDLPREAGLPGGTGLPGKAGLPEGTGPPEEAGLAGEAGPTRITGLESVDPGGVIARSIRPGHNVGCVVYCSTEIIEPGVIRHIEGTRFTIGEPDGSVTQRCKLISDAFAAGGLKAPVAPRLREQIWLKLVGNVAFNPITALTGATLGELAAVPEMPALLRAIFTECAAVAGRLGITFPVSLDRRLEAGLAVGDHKTSMLQDLEAGKRLELDCMTGAVAELAGRLGIDVPHVRTVHACARLLDQLGTHAQAGSGGRGSAAPRHGSAATQS